MKALKIATLFFMLIIIQQAHAQKKIVMYKTFGGLVYMLNDSIELSQKQTATLLFTHQQAYHEFKKARGWSTASAISGFIGATMIAIPLATLLFGEHADAGFAIGGALLLSGGLVCNWVYKGRALYAIDLYNNSLPQKTSRIKPQLFFYGTGAKLVIKF